ncbi:hypothetical protein Ddye_000605 [Dipteronia dyeriana]|uniref:Uncharacterized protein n=1 Tax=Dipteronia dyeriana TaxID=168575 RepID=A0AAD9XMI8_9ROSI|nr:hypothetical protein Ddye_000605 [Dipteronia dyeriana]
MLNDVREALRKSDEDRQRQHLELLDIRKSDEDRQQQHRLLLDMIWGLQGSTLSTHRDGPPPPDQLFNPGGSTDRFTGGTDTQAQGSPPSRSTSFPSPPGISIQPPRSPSPPSKSVASEQSPPQPSTSTYNFPSNKLDVMLSYSTFLPSTRSSAALQNGLLVSSNHFSLQKTSLYISCL